MKIDYQTIKPLIILEKQEGNHIRLQFKAQNQDTPLDAYAVVMPSQEDMMKNVTKQTAKTAVTTTGINAIFRVIGGLFGGLFGSVASSAGSMVSSQVNQRNMSADKLMSTEVSQKDREEAIVNTFKNYQSYYSYENGLWNYQIPVNN